MARPSDITPLKRKIIIEAIRGNLPYEKAARKARISEKTLYNWINKGLADEEEGIESERCLFLQDIKEAEADKMQALLDKIDDNCERWQASAWLLERRWREHFGQDAGIIAELQATFKELQAKLEANSK